MKISSPLLGLMVWCGVVGVAAQDAVSYVRDVAPLLAARCAGCHSPTRTKGDLDLSTHAALLRGGQSGPVIVPGHPVRSPLIAQVTGPDAEMPPKGAPLTEDEVRLLARWITEGARDDTSPARAAPAISSPRRYRSAPPNPAIAYAPDGRWLAVSGYAEILLHHSDGGGLAARLVGAAPRIESLAFSQDGKWLAAAGGSPGRFGEVQIWEVAKRRLHARHRLTSDTLYGVSLSPDASLVAFGCTDHTVRMLEVESGRERLLFRNHADWVLGTCFTRDGKRLVSGARDQALKIIDLAQARFVDDINNPLERVLSLARHPKKDVVVYGGDRGTPRIYRISDNQKRTAARRDTNLKRALERQSGPVHAVAFSADGALVAAGGADPRVRVHDTETGHRVAYLEGHRGAVFALAFHPRRPHVATCGQDGVVRTYEARSGKLVRAFSPVPTKAVDVAAATSPFLVALDVAPKTLDLFHAQDERRVVVTARTASGDRVDLTEDAALSVETPQIAHLEQRRIRPSKTGKTTLVIRAGALSARVPITVHGTKVLVTHFTRDVMPVLSRAGCNNGVCHGRLGGQNGFELSLRGFDPAGDHRVLVQELAGRRIDRVAPHRSLLLQKPTAAVPHEGGKVLDEGSRAYRTLLSWIESGAAFARDDASRITRLEVAPRRVDLALPGHGQHLVVTAHYADGQNRDVTDDAILEGSDLEIIKVDGAAVTAVRRGEAAVLVRYEGIYASTPVTVMGDRTGYTWQSQPVHGFIDRHVHAKLKRIKSRPSPPCTDAEFARRVYLDLTGRPPSPELARRFVASEDPKKRDRLIDALIGSPRYVEHWANKWADLLQCRSQTLGIRGVWVFREWLSRCIAENRPYDAFVRDLLTATGSTRVVPPANYLRAVSDKGRAPDPQKLTEDVAQTFLGIRFNCNRCHNHPFERWTQDQYYELAAHFAQLRFKKGKRPDELIVYESFDGGETTHPRTSRIAKPAVPFATSLDVGDAPHRRARLAEWLTSPKNPMFARSFVNRTWSYFFGRGIIEPVDDIRAGNPPVNPELLDALERHFVENGFDFDDLVRTICRSATYQASHVTDRWNADDTTNFARCIPRRLSAEQLLEAVGEATGVVPKIVGLPEGTRPVEVADGVVPGNDFLGLFGRPKRDSACECARSSNLSLAHALSLVNGTTIHDAIVSKRGRIARLVRSHPGDRAVVRELYWAALCRAPTETELTTFAAELAKGGEREKNAQDLLWALINSPAFLFNR